MITCSWSQHGEEITARAVAKVESSVGWRRGTFPRKSLPIYWNTGMKAVLFATNIIWRTYYDVSVYPMGAHSATALPCSCFLDRRRGKSLLNMSPPLRSGKGTFWPPRKYFRCFLMLQGLHKRLALMSHSRSPMDQFLFFFFQNKETESIKKLPFFWTFNSIFYALHRLL